MRIALILFCFLSLSLSSIPALAETPSYRDPQLRNETWKAAGRKDTESTELRKEGLDLSMRPFNDKVRHQKSGLAALDLSANGRLKILEVSTNQLTDLRLYPTNAIERLLCDNNKLTKLDLSRQRQLKELDCRSNQLSALDLSKNVRLEKLWSADNQLTRIDLSNNPKLTYVDLRGNPLVEIIVGDLERMTKYRLYYDGNPTILEAPSRKPTTDVSSWRFPVFSETVPTGTYDVAIRGKDINKELADAVTANDLRFTAYLLENGADPNYKADRHRSVLQTALKQMNFEIGELLLHHGAIIDFNTLTYSHLEGLKFLIAHGADVNASDGRTENTVLMRASTHIPSLPRDESDVIERIDLLIAHGAKINAINKEGQNVFHMAAGMGHVKTIRHLLSYDVDATLKTNKGHIALHTLVRRLEIHKTPDWLEASVIEEWENDRLAILEQVLQQKPDLNARDQNGRTALFDAKGKVAVLLLEHGADPNAVIVTTHPDYNGVTPLILAADKGDLEWMALLLKYGADPNAADSKGRTALDRIQERFESIHYKKRPEVFKQKDILVMKKLIEITGGTQLDRELVREGDDPVQDRLSKGAFRAFLKNMLYLLIFFGPLIALLVIAVVGLIIKKVCRSQTGSTIGSTIIWAALMSLIPTALFYVIALVFLGNLGWAAGNLIVPMVGYGWIVAISMMVLFSGLIPFVRNLLQRRRKRISA